MVERKYSSDSLLSQIGLASHAARYPPNGRLKRKKTSLDLHCNQINALKLGSGAGI
jgi:hypothetical protein